jgi:2-polyprenyl-3-methyl-5-hydroxy-6-metoxy-1,4-benzoquinol methylase
VSEIAKQDITDERFTDFATARTDGPGLHKWTHYMEYYDQSLQIGNSPVTVLEIGVQSGGSLDMWDKILPPGSVVVGIDINAECKRYVGNRVYIEIGSQSDIAFLNQVGSKYGPFDIIVDDGSHLPNHQEISLLQLIKYVKPGGRYIVEDIHGRDNSFTAFAFGLTSQLNEMRVDSGFFDCHTNDIQKSIATITFGTFFCTFQLRNNTLDKLSNFKSGSDWIPYR